MAEQGSSEQVRHERHPDYRRFFSNSFLFRFSAGDGNITFSELTEAPGAPLQNIIQEQANITMSWSQLKMLGEYITIAVQEMENELGPIINVGLPKEELQKQARAIIKGFAIRKK